MTNVEGMTKSETLPVRSFRDFLDDQAPATAGLQPYLFSENTGSPAPRPSEGVKKFDFRGEWASSPRPSPPEEEREKNRPSIFHSFSRPGEGEDFTCLAKSNWAVIHSSTGK